MSKLQLILDGPFRLLDGKGNRIQIKSKRALILVALLAKEVGKEKLRTTIQDFLWSTRPLENAQASLRQEVRYLHQLNKDCGVVFFGADRTRVWLCEDKIEVVEANGEFLEGIDLFGEERFEDWLRIQRQNSEENAASIPALEVSKPDASVLVVQVNTGLIDDPGAKTTQFSQRLIADRICENLSEFGGINVVRSTSIEKCGSQVLPIDVNIQIESTAIGDALYMNVKAVRAGSELILIQLGGQFPAGENRLLELNAELDVFANDVTHRVLNCIAQNEGIFSSSRHLASRSAMLGIQRLFSRDLNAANEAAFHFDEANSLNPSGVFHAWKAYLAALFLEDCPEQSESTVLEAAERNCEKSLELDPYNGLSLALLTHVHAYVFKDFDRAFEYLDRALAIRPDHVMTQDASALLNLYTGRLDEARAAAIRAAAMGRAVPFSYCFVTTLGMIETLAGNFASGARYCERALAMMPRANSKTYQPTLRYLGTCYAQLDRIEDASSVFLRLRDLEGPRAELWGQPTHSLMPSDEAANLFSDSVKKSGLIGCGK